MKATDFKGGKFEGPCIAKKNCLNFAICFIFLLFETICFLYSLSPLSRSWFLRLENLTKELFVKIMKKMAFLVLSV